MIRCCISFILLFASISSFGQKASYLTYGREEGLPQSQVRAITTDDEGFLWIGTLGGLSRFDGVSFKNFSKEDGLSDNQINCILKGKQLWIGTTGALCFVRGQEIISIPFPENYSSSRVLDIAESKDGSIWMATSGDGVLIYRDSVFSSIKEGDGLPDNYVRSIAFDPKGNLWIGTRSGIILHKKNGKLDDPSENALKNLSVSRIRPLKSGQMAISTFGNGVFIIGDEIRNLTERNGLPSNFIRSFVEMNSGELWFGSKNGLGVLRKGSVITITEKNGLPYDNVKSLGVDREGNLWIGTDGKGLLRRAGKSFQLFSKDEGLSSNLVMSFAKGGIDSLYVGSYDAGISIITPDTVLTSDLNANLPSQTVWCMIFTENTLYAGTSSGLFIRKGRSSAVLDRNSGLPGNRVTAISHYQNRIYVGLENGIACLDKSGAIHQVYTAAGNEDIRSVRAFLPDGNRLLFGAEGGVWELSSKNLNKQASQIGKETPVYCLEKDGEGNLWAGTSDGLMVRMNGSDSLKYIPLTAKPGSGNVNFLENMDDDYLFVGSNNGLYAIDLKSFSETGSIYSKHYGKFEGLSGAETNQNAVIKTGDELWFGTTDGAVRFSPELMSKTGESPELYISDIDLFLEDVDWNTLADSVSASTGLPIHPTLNHNQNYLTFNYSGIYFTNPEKVRYQYKVEGVDNGWLGPTRSRSATYAYLPHGDYVFKVRAFQIDAPGLVSESSFSFSIKPPFYLTNWFFALAFLFLVGLIYLIYSNRLKKEREKQMNLRMQLQSRLTQLEAQSLNSSMNRHFVFNALNSIQYYINMQDRKSANRYLTSFAKLIRKNLDSSLQTETSLSDELERLKLYLSLEQMRFQDKFEYMINVDPKIDLDAVALPAMMLQPFLENSIWHGILPNDKKGLIEISVTDESEYYQIRIDDNGVGIDTSLKSKSNGTTSHVSKGMDITLNRIKLYQNMTGQEYGVKGPFERRDRQGNILGTGLTIRLPKNPTVNKLKTEQTWKIEGENVI